jgi:hypothetical protein
MLLHQIDHEVSVAGVGQDLLLGALNCVVQHLPARGKHGVALLEPGATAGALEDRFTLPLRPLREVGLDAGDLVCRTLPGLRDRLVTVGGDSGRAFFAVGQYLLDEFVRSYF